MGKQEEVVHGLLQLCASLQPLDCGNIVRIWSQLSFNPELSCFVWIPPLSLCLEEETSTGQRLRDYRIVSPRGDRGMQKWLSEHTAGLSNPNMGVRGGFLEEISLSYVLRVNKN